jgi:hypothetical protein
VSDQALGTQGVLQVIPEDVLQQQEADRANQTAQANQAQTAQSPQELAGYIRGLWEIFRNHRNTAAGWSERLLVALRTFNGQYDANQLREIRRFGGSEVYARIIAQKCRAASSLLRDIYLGDTRPWGIKPPSSPKIPDSVQQNIDALLQLENQQVTQTQGKPPDPEDEQARRTALIESALDAAKKKAGQQAKDSDNKIEDILREGMFYHAFAEFLVDLPTFPFGVICGPEVKIIPEVVWPPAGGQPTIVQKPKLVWRRVAPFDIWWTPGVSSFANADIIEKIKFTRAELNDLLDLPGYNQDELRAVLDEYGRGGLYDFWDTTDAERAVLENKENPAWNRSKLIACMAFNGNIQGRMLQDYGLAVPDELRDYHVQAWLIGSHVIKCQLSPSPRQRPPYYITSFEKVPGTPIGNGLTDMLDDLQIVSNATLRGLVNNLSISSGPQVVVNDDRLSPDETGEDLYPWKRWHTRNDPVGNNARPPIDFFMPTSNTQALVSAYQEFVSIADDVSAIPKYVGGQAGAGGAGRTASGLAMLMGNSSKILQTVSANIDNDIMEPALLQLVDLIMLTDTTGLLTGEEKVSVDGVQVAIQKETQRQRQVEFLQATANPMDAHIIGIKGRGMVLREVAQGLGLSGDEIVPNDETLAQMDAAQRAQQQNPQQQALQQKVEQGVQQGVQAGVQKIASELTAGVLATRAGMPEGAPTHIGTPAAQPGMGIPPQGGGPAGPAGPGGPPIPGPPRSGGLPNMQNAARVASGTQPKTLTGGGQGPQGLAPRTNVVTSKGPNALPISPGVE